MIGGEIYFHHYPQNSSVGTGAVKFRRYIGEKSASSLHIETGALDNPITEENSGYYYNGFIYVNTPTKIYKVDIVKNTVELLYTKPSQTSYQCCGIGSKLYMLTISGWTQTIYHYDIENNTFGVEVTFEEDLSDVQGSSSTASIVMYAYKERSIITCLYHKTNRQYTYGMGGFIGRNIVTDATGRDWQGYSDTSVRADYYYTAVNTSNQITNDKCVVLGSSKRPNYYWYAVDVDNGECGVASLTQHNLYFTNSATLVINDSLYIFGGSYNNAPNQSVYRLNLASDELSDMNIAIPYTFTNRYAIRVDYDYYIFINEGYIKISL